MLCSKLHCQKGFNLNHFSYKLRAKREQPKREQLKTFKGFYLKDKARIWP